MARGRSLQIVVKFAFANGPALVAHPQESVYRDFGGLVATGTQPQIVGSDQESFGNIPITIPYYALNFAPTNGLNNYNLSLLAMAYLDGQMLAQTQPVPFGLRW